MCRLSSGPAAIDQPPALHLERQQDNRLQMEPQVPPEAVLQAGPSGHTPLSRPQGRLVVRPGTPTPAWGSRVSVCAEEAGPVTLHTALRWWGSKAEWGQGRGEGWNWASSTWTCLTSCESWLVLSAVTECPVDHRETHSKPDRTHRGIAFLVLGEKLLSWVPLPQQQITADREAVMP